MVHDWESRSTRPFQPPAGAPRARRLCPASRGQRRARKRRGARGQWRPPAPNGARCGRAAPRHAGQAAAQGEGLGDGPAWPDAAAPERQQAGNEDQDADDRGADDRGAGERSAVGQGGRRGARPTPPKVALRALVVAVDAEDFGVATWKPTLDRVGAAYDVLYTRTDPLTAATLVRPDGVGRYNAILLTNSMLLYDDGRQLRQRPRRRRVEHCCGPTSATSASARRRSTPATAPGRRTTACARPSEGGVGDTPLNAALTAGRRAASSTT